MRFSLIITTRKRADYLKNLIASINKTTVNKAEVEVHISYDNDDDVTARAIGEIVGKYPELQLQFHRRERSIWMHRDYINWTIFNFAHGKYILSFNDDVLFEKHNWDNLAWDKLEDYIKDKPDGVVYGNVEDGETSKANAAPWTGGNFTCFPLISRAAIDGLGVMFDDEFEAWNADIAIYMVYNNLGRILDLKNEIILKHLSTHSGRRNKDELDEETISRHGNSPPPHCFVERDTEILRRFISAPRKL
jgi:hypothetical protein